MRVLLFNNSCTDPLAVMTTTLKLNSKFDQLRGMHAIANFVKALYCGCTWPSRAGYVCGYGGMPPSCPVRLFLVGTPDLIIIVMTA